MPRVQPTVPYRFHRYGLPMHPKTLRLNDRHSCCQMPRQHLQYSHVPAAARKVMHYHVYHTLLLSNHRAGRHST